MLLYLGNRLILCVLCAASPVKFIQILYAMVNHLIHRAILNKSTLLVSVAAILMVCRAVCVCSQQVVCWHRHTATLAIAVHILFIFDKCVVDPVGCRLGDKLQYTILWVFNSTSKMVEHPVTPKRTLHSFILNDLHFARVNNTITAPYNRNPCLWVSFKVRCLSRACSGRPHLHL